METAKQVAVRVDLQDAKSSLPRWFLHGALWLLVYMIVFAWGALGNLWLENLLGLTNQIAVGIAYLAAVWLGAYWAHRIATRVVPL